MQDRIEINTTRWGRLAACASVFCVLGSLAMAWLAQAAESDCDTLLGTIARTGEVPAIIINPADETVKIATSEGICSESIDSWSKREPISPGSPQPSSPAKTVTPAPAPAPALAPQPTPKSVFTAPAPPAPSATPAPSGQGVPTGTATFTPDQPAEPIPVPQSVRPPSPAAKTPPSKGGCDYRLGEVWESQFVKVEGIEHYLARAFTLDLDNNRTVDNVSFTFIAKDGGKKVIHYYGAPGEPSGRDYPALNLPDKSLIGRICFDDLKYAKPKIFLDDSEKGSLIVVDGPDLAAQKEAKDRGIVY